jgi:hypothetical protein
MHAFFKVVEDKAISRTTHMMINTITPCDLQAFLLQVKRSPL